VTKDVPTVLVNPRTETGISAVVTGQVWYVNISRLEYQVIFANVYSCEKVQCKGGRWREIRDCGRGTCHGGNDGGAVC
jgi:hypothetical protein